MRRRFHLAYPRRICGISTLARCQIAELGNDLVQQLERLLARSVACIDRPVTLPPGRRGLRPDRRRPGQSPTRKRWGSSTWPLLSRHSRYGGHDHVDRELDEFRCDLCGRLGMRLRPAKLDSDGAALDPAEFTQPLLKGMRSSRSLPLAVVVPRKPTSGILPGCCARAASGQATAAPPMSVMKSRRFISPRDGTSKVPCRLSFPSLTQRGSTVFGRNRQVRATKEPKAMELRVWPA